MHPKQAIAVRNRAAKIQQERGGTHSTAIYTAHTEFLGARRRQIAGLRTFAERLDPYLANTWHRTDLGEWLFQQRARAELSRDSFDLLAGLFQGSAAAFENGTRVPTPHEASGIASAISTGVPFEARHSNPPY